MTAASRFLDFRARANTLLRRFKPGNYLDACGAFDRMVWQRDKRAASRLQPFSEDTCGQRDGSGPCKGSEVCVVESQCCRGDQHVAALQGFGNRNLG